MRDSVRERGAIEAKSEATFTGSGDEERGGDAPFGVLVGS